MSYCCCSHIMEFHNLRAILLSRHYIIMLTCSYFSLVMLSDFVVDQTQAVKFALDIACGMAFLHTLEPMIPRHYLNSKSVMVNMRCTIDFSTYFCTQKTHDLIKEH